MTYNPWKFYSGERHDKLFAKVITVSREACRAGVVCVDNYTCCMLDTRYRMMLGNEKRDARRRGDNMVVE